MSTREEVQVYLNMIIADIEEASRTLRFLHECMVTHGVVEEIKLFTAENEADLLGLAHLPYQ